MDKHNDKRLIEAAKLIQEHCGQADCRSCIFGHYGRCMFVDEDYEYSYDYTPWNWDIPLIRGEQ